MLTKKEALIDKLLEKKEITPEEALILAEKEIQFVPVNPQPSIPINPLPQVPSYPITPLPINPQQPWYPAQQSPMDKWANDEMNRRMEILDRCPCNPKNGGSGVCHCTLTGSVIYCSTVPINNVTLS